MSKGKKRCFFCQCDLTPQNKTTTTKRSSGYYENWIWLDCCHRCKAKQDKNLIK